MGKRGAIYASTVLGVWLFITAFHNRVGRPVASREVAFAEAVAIVPIVVVILVLAVYPQFGLKRSEPSLRATIAPAQIQAASGHAVAVASR